MNHSVLGRTESRFSSGTASNTDVACSNGAVATTSGRLYPDLGTYDCQPDLESGRSQFSSMEGTSVCIANDKDDQDTTVSSVTCGLAGAELFMGRMYPSIEEEKVEEGSIGIRDTFPGTEEDNSSAVVDFNATQKGVAEGNTPCKPSKAPLHTDKCNDKGPTTLPDLDEQVVRHNTKMAAVDPTFPKASPPSTGADTMMVARDPVLLKASSPPSAGANTMVATADPVLSKACPPPVAGRLRPSVEKALEEHFASEERQDGNLADRNNRDETPAPATAPHSGTFNEGTVPGAFAVFQSGRAPNTDSNQTDEEEGISQVDDLSADDDAAGEELVMAELVTPPVEAIEVKPVSDSNGEEEGSRQASQTFNTNTTHCVSSHGSSSRGAPSHLHDIIDDLSPKREDSSTHGRLSRRQLIALLCCGFALFAVVVATGVVLGVTLDDEDSSRGYGQDYTAPSFPYQCYNTSKSLNHAQLDFPQQELFIVCPGTHIKVGILDMTDPDVSRFKNGQDPLIAVKENMEIRCGLDGSVSNNCILDGGQIQFLINDNYYGHEDGELSRPTNNVTVRGMTFTGDLHPHELFGSASVVISNPAAKNTRFVDCRWDSMTAPSNLFYVGLNAYQWIMGTRGFPAGSMDVSIINSSFTNITYQSTMLRVINQTLSVEGTIFKDIKLPGFIRDCSFSQDYCLGLMYCYEESRCSLQDICVDNMDYFGSAALLGASNNTEWNVSGVNAVNNLNIHPYSPASMIAGGVCKSGVAQYDSSFQTVECWEPEADQAWGQLDTCPLR